MKKNVFIIALLVMGSMVFAQSFSVYSPSATDFNVMSHVFTTAANVVNSEDILKIVIISSIVVFILAKILSHFNHK